MMRPWSFDVWGIDLIGLLPTAKEGARFVIVIVYFTRWVEAEHLSTISTHHVVKFVMKNNVIRYGLSYKIITENDI